MEPHTVTERRRFAVILVLGPPGSGKGTICNSLARKYNLLHFSVGDNLRAWMKANSDSPLASTIQDRLNNQGFLTSAELNPFLNLAINDAMQRGARGIMIDGFPRCEEQLKSWAPWPFQQTLPLLEGDSKPDVVLLLSVARDTAKTRYVARGRDGNDGADKFKRRFAEYVQEGRVVEEHYRQAGLIVDIDNNGTKEDSLSMLESTLLRSPLWRSAVVD
ncbi:adenylate kinase 1 ATP binding protein [Colletotrichum cereale]|nr:adenylate kinase 1 ATP binding protein [Colletotrichum cereale]